jgi:hypothetical protein
MARTVGTGKATMRALDTNHSRQGMVRAVPVLWPHGSVFRSLLEASGQRT